MEAVVAREPAVPAIETPRPLRWGVVLALARVCNSTRRRFIATDAACTRPCGGSSKGHSSHRSQGVVLKGRVEKHTGKLCYHSCARYSLASRSTGAPSQTSLRQLTRLVAEAAAAADRHCARHWGRDPRAAFLARWTRGSECTRARLARGSHAPHPTRLGSQLQRHCPDWNVPRAWAARACASCGARVPARRRRAPTPIFCDAMHELPQH